ncbi:MAG: hypothetical protein ACLFQ1_04360 [Halochromatium sp.]|uniref:hypothetical protein n=1 Tax=Halochromatium sp. TaxID=2049430 RepID=UPI00397CCB37
MSEATAVPSTAPAKSKTKTKAKTKPKTKRYQSPLYLALLPQIVLFASAVVLFWLSQKDMAGTVEYWEYFIPVIALISLISGWSQSYLSDQLSAWYLIKQVVHWGAVFALLYAANTQGLRESLDAQQYTSIVIYLTALASLLAAMHMDFKLFFFSLFLVFCAYLLAVPADNAMLLYIGETVGIDDAESKTLSITIGMAVVGFIASTFVLLSMRGMVLSKRLSNKRIGNKHKEG